MTLRIALWALIGAVIAWFWVIFGMLALPWFNVGRSLPVAVTVPGVLFLRTIRIPLSYYWFILCNATTYALIGLAVEPLLRRHRQPS
jgi:hypothetical protein